MIGPDFSGLLDLISPSLAGRRERWVVIVDGGSGAGKTTLAHALRERCAAAQLVSLDECYPGWDGLAAASAMVTTDILHPTAPGFRRWDWGADAPADWVGLDPNRPLIVEGCGALTSASAAYATVGVWLERPAYARRRAALARDKAAYAPHWDRWAAQESRHWADHRPWLLADLVCESGGLRGSASPVAAPPRPRQGPPRAAS